MADCRRFTLYMSGSSYYSQKVILALIEKNEPFTEKLVNNRLDDNLEPWFMKINPAGKIPVLDDKGTVIPESEDILDYLDTEISRATRLVPDPSTDLGQEVAKFRKMLDVNVPILTFGTAYNPSLAPEGKSEKSQSELDAAMNAKIAKLESLAVQHPDLKEAYLAKIPPLRSLQEGRKDLKFVQKVIDDLQTTMDVVEDRIVKSCGSSGQTWLFGSDYTAADISLTALLRRLSQLGLASLYFSPTKRPSLYKYWQRLQTYSSFCKLLDICAKYTVKT